MNKAELNKLKGILEDVKKIDSMILLHQTFDDSDFMTSQYQAKKSKLISEIIAELISPSFQSVQSFSFIQMILNKYYPNDKRTDIEHNEDIDQLAAVL